MIYLDANATTPLLPEVLDAMLPWLREGFHNPNASYRGAKVARRAIEQAREQVASLIGCRPSEIVFTGGGTESTNTALKWLARLVGRKTGTVITSAIEHSAVLKPCETFAEVGYPVIHIGVNPLGRLDVASFEEACVQAKTGGGFASIMWANNETGVIQPLEEVAAITRRHGLALHTDAIQAVGKIPLDVSRTPVDFLSLSAHKFHGPKGAGALYVREGCRFEPLLRGGGQESGRRSGTENTAAIVGMGKAAELAQQRLQESSNPVGKLRDTFEQALLAAIPDCEINGDPHHRLPGTSHVSFQGCEAAGLLILLDEMGVACSAGSACMTGKQQPSHVQKAMGFTDQKAKSSLRFGFSMLNTQKEVPTAAAHVAKAVEKLRRVQGPGVGPVVVYRP